MISLIKTNVQEDGIMFINFNRPPVNALSTDFINELKDIFLDINKQKNIRVVIINSLNDNFCAGADLKERKIMSLDGADIALDNLNECFNLIENCRVPTIAAINGYCLGGGAELALCCDFRILEESSIIGFPEVTIGIIPGAGGTQRLSRLTSISIAKYWIYTGRKFVAEEALEDGVVDFLANDGELLETAIELAEEIICNAPLSIESSKKAINDGLKCKDLVEGLTVERENYRLTLNSEDRKEALDAFVEKRKPKWKGK